LDSEDKGLSSDCYRVTQDACNTRLPLREVQLLGQDIRQLGRSYYVEKRHVTVLDYFMHFVAPINNDGLIQLNIAVSSGSDS
jgi:hypothetical protein